jgi:flagellar protein FliS
MRAYQRVRITTASPSELVVLLFEGLVRFVGSAASAMSEQRYAEAGQAFERSVEIIAHLRESLDTSGAQAVVDQLDKTYVLWMKALVKAQLSRDVNAAEDIARQVSDLLGAWRHAAEAHPVGAR